MQICNSRAVVVLLAFLMVAPGALLAQQSKDSERGEDCGVAAKLVKQGLEKKDGSDGELALYLEATERCPGMPEAVINQAAVLVDQNKSQEGIEALQNFRKKFKNTQVDVALAAALERSVTVRPNGERQGEGPSLVGSVTEIEPRSADLLRQAQSIYQEVLKDEPDNTRALEGLGSISAKSGRWAEAAQFFSSALKKDPQHSRLLFNLAVALDRSGQLDQAETLYEQIISQQSSHQEALRALGLLKLRRNDPAGAKAVLQRVTSATDWDARLGLAVSHLKTEDLESAEVLLRKLVDDRPADNTVVAILSETLLKLQKPEEAERFLQPLLAAHGNDPHFLFLLGSAKADLGKLAEAKEILTKASGLNPSDAQIHNNLGITLMRMGDREEAQRELDAALKLDPNLETAKNNRALL